MNVLVLFVFMLLHFDSKLVMLGEVGAFDIFGKLDLFGVGLPLVGQEQERKKRSVLRAAID